MALRTFTHVPPSPSRAVSAVLGTTEGVDVPSEVTVEDAVWFMALTPRQLDPKDLQAIKVASGQEPIRVWCFEVISVPAIATASTAAAEPTRS